MSNFKFNKSSIVESLCVNDKKAGQELKRDLETLGIFPEKAITIDCVLISCKEKLISHIYSLTEDARQYGIFPVLGTEAHGSNDKQGLSLKLRGNDRLD